MGWCRTDAAVVQVIREQIVVDNVIHIHHRDRSSSAPSHIVAGVARSGAGGISGHVREPLLQRQGAAKIKDAHNEYDEQRQGDGKLGQLSAALASQPCSGHPIEPAIHRVSIRIRDDEVIQIVCLLIEVKGSQKRYG